MSDLEKDELAQIEYKYALYELRDAAKREIDRTDAGNSPDGLFYPAFAGEQSLEQCWEHVSAAWGALDSDLLIAAQGQRESLRQQVRIATDLLRMFSKQDGGGWSLANVKVMSRDALDLIERM